MCRRYCPTTKKKTYSKSTSQCTYHIKSLIYFTFIMFSSCCRGTQTGNRRCRYQSPTHVNTNTNLRGTIIPTTCTSIKYSTCKILNPLRSGGGMSLNLPGASNTTIMKMSRWSILIFLMYIHNQIGNISKGLTQTIRIPIPFLNTDSIKT